MAQLLITDLDNTLYNWMDYFAPSFRGMVHALSREMNVEEDFLYAEFKKVFSKSGSVEYSFAIQELEFVQQLSKEEIQKFVDLGKQVFSRVRQKNLVPYDGVEQTLKWATQAGILVIGVSNAPLFHAQRRLTKLNIDKYFYGLAAWEGNETPDNEHTTKITERVKNNSYRSRVKRLWSFTKDETKPSNLGYKRVITDLANDFSSTYIVGDSIAKDIEPAMELGAIGIWAKYGLDFERKNYETVLKITPWTDKKQEEAYLHKTKEPDYTINSFSEIMGIVKPNQLQIFE